ncbi:putative gustatory receptor 59d isoform 1-T1 [Cochliomyia hominivorax]
MKRSTHFMIKTVYIYAQLLGILNFCYNCRTGKARVKSSVTIYSAAICVLMFVVTLYFVLNLEIKTRPPGGAELHYKLNLLASAVRCIGVIITIFYNWTKRKDYVRLINSFRKFCRKFLKKWNLEEKYIKYLECGIRVKLKRSFLADIVMYLFIVNMFREIFDIENSFILLPLALIPTVLNVVMNLYYFAILNINTLMLIINEELKRVLDSAIILNQTLPQNHIRHSSQMAEELDELALIQYQLWDYLKRINKMYDIQGVCVVLDLYVNNIYVIYMFCMFSEHFDLWISFGKWIAYFIPLSFIIYYLDVKLFLFAMLNTIDLVEETGRLLKERKVWIPSNLDGRLERSLNNFSLQLASFPVEFDLVGLFKMNRSMAFATFSSTISNAIVLIQYDLKYTKKY